ncbi:MAG: mannose-6-phosphate isomerase [Frankiaceae bacterium]|nr:mannose-6-phosphate isomerase [Frankiaceae bacterium]
MYQLTNQVMDYPWGSVDAIPELLGTAPTGRPQAEMWVGAHPSAPSRAITPGGEVALDELIARSPADLLGADVARRFGGRLPFLVKILSAAAPLSLQVHPSKSQAERGYAAEDAAGKPADAADRNYKDANHKPELLYALTPFEALCGFAPPARSAALLERVREQSGPLGVLDALIADLAGADESAALRGATERLLALDQAAAGELVAAVVGACAGLDDPSAGTARELADDYPGDAGVVLSLLLNRVSLAPGEALYLPAGNIHAYLRGTGVEIMATSDNVLRGGLTSKHVDVAELVATLDFTAYDFAPDRPRVTGSGSVEFRPPVDDFALAVAEIAAGSGLRWVEPVPRTVIVLDGDISLAGAGGRLTLRRGESAFVSSSDAPVDVSGTGRLAAGAPNI